MALPLILSGETTVRTIANHLGSANGSSEAYLVFAAFELKWRFGVGITGAA